MGRGARQDRGPIGSATGLLYGRSPLGSGPVEPDVPAPKADFVLNDYTKQLWANLPRHYLALVGAGQIYCCRDQGELKYWTEPFPYSLADDDRDAFFEIFKEVEGQVGEQAIICIDTDDSEAEPFYYWPNRRDYDQGGPAGGQFIF